MAVLGFGFSSAGRQRLAGAVGKASEGVAVADGDVGQDLAVELDAGELETVHELRVRHVVLARTALGPNGSAVPGPMATLAAPKASAERRIVPTLPGSWTPCR